VDTISHVRSFFRKNSNLDSESRRQVVLKVNRLMDVMGAGPDGRLHCWRKFLHHREGIDYVRTVYGEVGALAAEQHILDDCGSIHSVLDYYNGTLDENGVEKSTF